MKRAARFRPFFAAHPVRNAKAGVQAFCRPRSLWKFSGPPEFCGKRALGDFFCTLSAGHFYPPLPHRRLPPRSELLGEGWLPGRGRFLLEGGQEKRTPLDHLNPRHGGATHPYCRRRKYRAEKWRNAPLRLFQTPSKGGNFPIRACMWRQLLQMGDFPLKSAGRPFFRGLIFYR